MTAELGLLNSRQMATFAARGFLRFDAAVPDAINQQFMDEAGRFDGLEGAAIGAAYARFMQNNDIPAVPAGTPLDQAYPADSALAALLDLPQVAGAIRSLVGEAPIFDHHFLHVALPPAFYAETGQRQVSQHTHQDSTIDPRRAFDVQIMYYPHAVTAEMGGTRFVPGTHLRVVSEAAIARYQNIRGQQHVVCPAGTLLFMHMGIWHGGGINRSDVPRYMFKIRLGPSGSQVRQWDTSDLDEDDFRQRPIFWVKEPPAPDSIMSILTQPEPWFEQDTGRLEYINRIRLWRYLLGDDSFDADYWLTRVENHAELD